MNIILVSGDLAKSRTLSLSGMQVGMMLFALMLLSALLLQPLLQHFSQEGLANPAMLMLSSEERQKQQSYVRSSLDMMAAKLGQMQAQLQRLDALGGRLAKLTGMNPHEFQFDQPPAQGGPLVLPRQAITSATLEQQLEALSQIVADRNDKLLALETMLLQNSLSRNMLPSAKPIDTGWYSSNFGWRTDPFTGRSAMHEGVDYMVGAGTPIHASAGGVVAYAAYHAQYGNMVEIDHGNDIVTRYAHASKLVVKVGQVVRRGEKIAEVGSTGRSTGNHLHFEVRYKGSAQNPVRFLQKAAS